MMTEQQAAMKLFANNQFKFDFMANSVHAFKHTADNEMAEFLTIMNIMCWNAFVEAFNNIPKAVQSVTLLSESESDSIEKMMTNYREDFIRYIKNKGVEGSIISKYFLNGGTDRSGNPLTVDSFFEILRSNNYDEILSCIKPVAESANHIMSQYANMMQTSIDHIKLLSGSDLYPKA